ncbi:MAG: M48 family metallopeptidase [Synergistaceae bacterium]|nr:M48 family metallopeptidase [Synergistaceae bacterium]
MYDHIAANNRKTVKLLCAFPVALFITVFLFAYLLTKTGVLSLAELGIAGHGAPNQALELTLYVYPWMFLAAAVWIIVSYRAGGAMILGMTNARRVTLEENRDLFRLVENTAIMAGLPTPEIYLIDDEALNAFATGRKPEAASIALTAGIVKKLNKAELQAVIAHELAHIGNRDTRLMLITVAGIGCFMFFGELLCRVAFRSSLRGGARGGRKGGGGKGTLLILAIGIVCLVFGYIVAPVLRLALSRRREYQADATAVKITRDPEALSRALTKISFDSKAEVLGASSLVGNMCIANPAKAGFVSRLYSTHPPIEDRVTALENMMGKDREPQTGAQVGRAVW